MSVEEVRLHSIGPSASAEGDSPQSVRVTYNGSYRVKVSSALDGPNVVLDHFRRTSELPWFGRTFRFGNSRDTSVICQGVDPKYVEGSDGWYDVTVEWGPRESDQTDEDGHDEDGESQDDPLLWHEDIDVSYTQMTVVADKGIYRGGMKERSHQLRKVNTVGPIVNSALVPFDPPLEREVDIKVIRFTKNIPKWTAADWDKLQGKVNKNKVVINKVAYQFFDSWEPYHARIKSIGGRWQFANGRKYWARTIEVWVNPLGWRYEVLDQGMERRAMAGDKDDNGEEISPNDIVEGQPQWSKMKDAEGYPLTAPVNLNGDGQPLKPGDPPVYLTYSIIDEIDFPNNLW